VFAFKLLAVKRSSESDFYSPPLCRFTKQLKKDLNNKSNLNILMSPTIGKPAFTIQGEQKELFDLI
jgi:hypothetical protein